MHTTITTYQQGRPRPWDDDPDGELATAVHAVLRATGMPAASTPSTRQLALVRSYLRYAINAPCWDDLGLPALSALRRDIAHVASVRAIDAWLDGCTAIGIDPL